MPVHDWSRVDAGTFHAFHTAWITHLSEALNDGLLPAGYYALPEQHGGRLIADVLTLQIPLAAPHSSESTGGLAVADAPPKVRHRFSPTLPSRGSQRTLTIRHVSGHRMVALVEIVSPANKDRASHVAEFAGKVESALRQSIHVLMIDLFPPGPHDPHSLHNVIWERFDDEPYQVPPEEPLTLGSYVAEPIPTAYLENLAVGAPLIDMPLFLNPDRYINVPLESAYAAAFHGLPAFLRELLVAP